MTWYVCTSEPTVSSILKSWISMGTGMQGGECWGAKRQTSTYRYIRANGEEVNGNQTRSIEPHMHCYSVLDSWDYSQ